VTAVVLVPVEVFWVGSDVETVVLPVGAGFELGALEDPDPPPPHATNKLLNTNDENRDVWIVFIL